MSTVPPSSPNSRPDQGPNLQESAEPASSPWQKAEESRRATNAEAERADAGSTATDYAEHAGPSHHRENAAQGNPGASADSKTAGSKATAHKTGATQKPAKKGKASQSTEDGTPHNWGMFRLVVALYGAIIIAYGVWQVLAGTGSLPDQTSGSNPTVASSYGALAAVLCGVGAALITIAIKFKWANMLAYVCFTIFLGGIGRILSWAIFGLPHWIMIVVMVLDLVLPPCLVVWYGWITKANKIRREMAQQRPGAATR